MLALICARPVQTAAPLSEHAAIQAFQDELGKEAASDKFSGVALVAKNGKPIFEQAYGLADRDKKVPNRDSTEFNLGSDNKVFTSVAILQLAEAGKLKLTDPIGKYLTDYPNKDVAKVSIELLLEHRGATGDFFGPDYPAHRNELKTLQDYVRIWGSRGLQGTPGGKPAYSNYGYILLGMVIERASGEDYYSYIDQHIYRPAGMTSSGSFLASDKAANRAIGYTLDDNNRVTPNDDSLPYRGSSAGGGYSTAEDLLRFYNALWDHRLINAHSVDLLTKGEASVHGGPVYPLGMGGLRANGVRYYAHAGGAPGINAEMESSPETGYTIVVLANRDPMIAMELAKFVRERLPAIQP